MLQGEAKRDYMREYMRKKRAGGVTRKSKDIEDIDKKIAQWQTKFQTRAELRSPSWPRSASGW